MDKIVTPRLILREIKSKDIFGYSELLSDEATMKLFGGAPVRSDLEIKNVIENKRKEYEEGISIFWVITLIEEKEFIGFIRLMNYNSSYFDASFAAMGELKNSTELLSYIDKTNGWEIDYALFKEYRGHGIMTESIRHVLNHCIDNDIAPVYAKVNSLTNKATVAVLLKNDFGELLPQKNSHGNLGMIYKWPNSL